MPKTEAQGEPEPQGSPVREAALDAIGGAIRIAGAMVQMAVGITRLLVAAALKAAAVAEGAVAATDRDGEKARAAGVTWSSGRCGTGAVHRLHAALD